MSNMNELVEACLMEMFRRVGLDFAKFSDVLEWANRHGDDWYKQEAWTEEEQEDFSKWMYKYLAKKTRWSASARQKECSFFILMWGWTCRDGGTQ